MSFLFFFLGKNGILYLSKLNVITSSETDRNRVSRHCFRLLSMRDIYLSKYREKRFFLPFFASVWTNPDTPERCFSAVLPAWRIEIYDRRVIERHERLKRSRAMRKSHASNTCFDANNTSTEKGCTSPKILLVNRDLISKIISWYNCVILLNEIATHPKEITENIRKFKWHVRVCETLIFQFAASELYRFLQALRSRATLMRQRNVAGTFARSVKISTRKRIFGRPNICMHCERRDEILRNGFTLLRAQDALLDMETILLRGATSDSIVS